MKKKLTRESFSSLLSNSIVISETEQRTVVGGGYFDDYGVGYYDNNGNYYWLRTQEGDSSFNGNFWDSISNSGSNNGFYYHDPSCGYGSSNNPISIDDYNRFAKAGMWNGGYIQNFGYIAVYASSVEYGNSVYLAGSWHKYGDYLHPISQTDFYKLVDQERWNGGYVQGFDYVLPSVTILGTSGNSNNGSFSINNATSHLTDNALNSSSGYCAKYVREAIEAGGLSTDGRPGSACDYDAYLPTLGFSIVDMSNYVPQPGDIVVHEATSGHPYGHIAMYNGEQWISDFIQSDMYGGSAYRSNPNYTILRWNQ